LVDAGGVPARVFENSDNSTVWAELSVLHGLQAVHRLLSPLKQGQEQQALLTAVLNIGEREVEPTGRQEDRRAYDLSSAIEDYLHSLPPANSIATIPVTLTSALHGLVTVYPPLIEYDLE